MCYIFSCFGWALDFIQRALTFILACILCFFVCTGILVAIAAGVAYGYNYSMAEFLTFTRQDTTVYMRRGQFYDKPDFDTDKDIIYSRRSGDGGVNMPQNGAGDGENLDTSMMRSGEKGLQHTWSEIKDTRKYAEMLTKFTRVPPLEEEKQMPEPVFQLTRTITPAPYRTTFPAPSRTTPPAPYRAPPELLPIKRVSIPPNPRLVSTVLMPSGASNIVMRKFKPVLASQPPSTRPDLEMANSDDESDMEIDSDQFGSGLYSDEEQQRRTKFYQLEQRRPTLPDLPPGASDERDGIMEQRRPTLADLPRGASDERKEKQLVPMRHWAVTKPPSSPARTNLIIDYKEDVDEDNVVYKPI